MLALSFHSLLPGRRLGRLMALVGTASLSACVPGERPAPPPVPVPTQWNADTTQGAWPSSDWWRGFGSSELNRLIEAAQARNQTIAAAIATVQQADAQARIAGAALLPTLNLQPGATTERSVGQSAQTSTGDTGSSDARYISTVTGVLSASYEVDLWGQARDARDSARKLAQASAYALAVTRMTITASVASTYFNLLGVQDQIAYATADANAARRILEGLIVQKQYGLVTELQVEQQRTIALQLEAAVPPLEAQRVTLSDALAILTGTVPQGFSVTGGSLAMLTLPEVPVGLPSDLLVHRPDVQEAERQLAAADANVSVARKSFLPSFSLTASGGAESIALSSALANPVAIFNLGLSVLQPIFEGGRLRGQLDFANASYRQLAANYIGAIQQAYGDVEDALATERGARLQSERQRLATASADRALELARIAFRAGTTDVLTLLAAEQAAAEAHEQQTQADLSRALGLVSLYKALGGGWEKEPLTPER